MSPYYNNKWVVKFQPWSKKYRITRIFNYWYLIATLSPLPQSSVTPPAVMSVSSASFFFIAAAADRNQAKFINS